MFQTKALHHEVIVIHHHFLQAEGEVNKVFIVVSLKMTQVLIKLKMDGNVILFLGNIVGEKVLGKFMLHKKIYKYTCKLFNYPASPC